MEKEFVVLGTHELNEGITMPVDITVTEEIGVGSGAITAREMTRPEAEQEAEEASRFLKHINWQDPAVCIDGRRLAEIMKAMKLGAHIAGGIETPLVAAQSVGYHLQGAELASHLKDLGFTLGGHDADTNKAENYVNGTGCGACEKCEGNCSLFAQHSADVEPTMQALLGADFNKEVYDKVQLVPYTSDIKDIVGEDLIETLHNDGKGHNGHREQLVIFNYIENTTIDREAYIEGTKSEEYPDGKQVFVVDMWYLHKLANAMATGVNAEQQASELYHAMVAFQVATYLGLCDGKHRAAVFQAKQEEFATAA